MPDDIQPIIYDLYKRNPSTGKKTAKRTLERYLNELKHVFEYARKQRCYNYPNPCDDVTIPEKAIEEIKTNAAIMQEDFIKNILNERNI